MDQKYCMNCMMPSDKPICPNCGCGAQNTNGPDQLTAGTVIGGKYLVGLVQNRLWDGFSYIGRDMVSGETVRIREYFPQGSSRSADGSLIPGDPGAFARGLELFTSRGMAITQITDLSQVCGAQELLEQGGTACLITKDIRGTTLERYVTMRGSLPGDEALRLLQGVFRAVAALHRAGFAHGGISGHTVLLDPRGGARLVAVAENPGASQSRDAADLCHLLAQCLSRGGEGLTPSQRDALDQGLNGGFPGGAELYRALFEAPRYADTSPVTAPADSLSANTSGAEAAEPAFPPTEIISSFKIDQPERHSGDIPQPERKAAPETVHTAPVVEYPRQPVTEAVPASRPSQPPAPPQPPVKEKKDKKTLIIAVAAVLIALIAAAVVLVLTVHVWQDATCTKPQRCALCGKTEGEALGHDMEEATCLDAAVCSVCGKTEGKALGHSWAEATCVAPKTCTVCGETEGAAGGHSWTEATCTLPKTCSVCGQTEGSAAGHDWKAATYTEPKTCKSCGLTEGSIRGYYATVPTHSERFHTNTVSGWCQEFDEPREDVYKFSISVEITRVDYGSAHGRWEAFYRTDTGKWVSLGYVEMRSDKATFTFTFDEPVNITAATAVIATSGNFSFSSITTIKDLYCYD